MGEKYNGTQRKTKYGDFLYDSTLEAQWAFFLDEVGIKAIPHPASFRTGKKYGNGEEIAYTPDFYLCNENLYCEVKPTNDLLRDRETQRKISAAMEGNCTPIGHGLLILGPMANFKSNTSKKFCLRGEYYEWLGNSIIKSYWNLGKNHSGEAKTNIFIDDPLWESDFIYSCYPYLGQNPTVTLAARENNEHASEIVYKAIFDAIYAKDNGLFTFEETETSDDGLPFIDEDNSNWDDCKPW